MARDTGSGWMDDVRPGGDSASGSLRVRMVLSAAIVLAVFLGVMGLVLDNAYRQSAEQTVSERLLLHIYALIAATNEESGDVTSLYLPDELSEPHFNNLGSGLYGIVLGSDGREIWRSRSALDLVLDDDELALLRRAAPPGEVTFGRMAVSPHHDELFYLTYQIIWQGSQAEARYIYAVLEQLEPFRNEVVSFRNSLWGWLIAGVLLLVGVQMAIMYWGLRPIAALEEDLKAIEQGRQGYLEGHYPREIAGVTRSLNLLLSVERKQRERYRTTLADLAHSLKTPLAILKTETSRSDRSPDALGALMEEQVGRMNDIISYQLERAVASSSTLIRSRIAVQPVVGRLIDALAQVYRDKQLEFKAETEGAFFPGDERDLMELLGNLLDNACKYGRHTVHVRANCADQVLTLDVEDDGAGIGEEDTNRVLRRGQRLDAQVAGQGIGLAVVAEILDRYEGAITISSSSLGGALVRIRLPLR